MRKRRKRRKRKRKREGKGGRVRHRGKGREEGGEEGKYKSVVCVLQLQGILKQG